MNERHDAEIGEQRLDALPLTFGEPPAVGDFAASKVIRARPEVVAVLGVQEHCHRLDRDVGDEALTVSSRVSCRDLSFPKDLHQRLLFQAGAFDRAVSAEWRVDRRLGTVDVVRMTADATQPSGTWSAR